MDPWTWAIENGDHVSVVVVLLLAGIGLYKRWIVIGWQYEEVRKQRDTYQTIIDTNNARLEAKVEKYEQERFGNAPTH